TPRLRACANASPTKAFVCTVLRPPKGWPVRLSLCRGHRVCRVHHRSKQLRRRWLRCVDDPLELGRKGHGLLGLVWAAIAKCVRGGAADWERAGGTSRW